MVQRRSPPLVYQREAPAGHWCARGKPRQAIGVPEGSFGRPLLCQREASAGHRGGTRSKLCHRGGTRSKMCHRESARAKLCRREGARSKLCHREGTSPSYASEKPAGTCTIPVIPAGMTITYNLSMNTFSICKILGRSIRYQRFYI